MFIINNHASFHLWWQKNLVKYQKVSKYYDHYCSSYNLFVDLVIIIYNYSTKQYVLNRTKVYSFCVLQKELAMSRGGCRAAATSKMERFVIIVNSSPRFASESMEVAH